MTLLMGGGRVFSPRRPVQGPGSDRNRTQTGPRDPQAVPEQHGEAAPRRGSRVHLPSWDPQAGTAASYPLGGSRGHTCQLVHSPGWGQGPELSAPCDVSDAPPPQSPLGLPCDSSRSTWSKSKVIEGSQSEG